MAETGPEDLLVLLVRHRLTSAQEVSRGLEAWKRAREAGSDATQIDALVRSAGVPAAAIARLLNETGLRLATCAGCGRTFGAAGKSAPACPGCRTLCRWLKVPGDPDDSTRVQRPAVLEGGEDEEGPLGGGRYERIGLLGRGGMGVVYLAHDSRFDRMVAIKTVRLERRDGSLDLQRFEREARMLAKLQHPNVVSVFDLDLAAEPPYLVMEYVEGETFEDALAGNLDRRKALRILAMEARGVAAAHEQGIVHRDLKPANVLVDRSGVAKVTDFGLAREIETDAGITQGDYVPGTPAYMAPEQHRREPERIGPWTDVYALGIQLYRVLYGRFPFDGSSWAALQRFVLSEGPRPGPPEGRPYSPALHKVYARAISRDPERRHATAAEFLKDLNGALAMSSSGITHRARRRGVGPLLASIAAAVLVVLAAVTALTMSTGGKDEPGKTSEARAEPAVSRPPAPTGEESPRPEVARDPVPRARVAWSASLAPGAEWRILGSVSGVVVLADDSGDFAAHETLSGKPLWVVSRASLVREVGNVEVARLLVEKLWVLGNDGIVGVDSRSGALQKMPRDGAMRHLRSWFFESDRAVLVGHPRVGFFGWHERLGRISWPPGNWVRPAAIWESGDVMAVAFADGGLQILEPADGSVLWAFPGETGRRDDAATVRLDPTSRVLLHLAAGRLRAFDWRSGSALWEREAPDLAELLGADRERAYLVAPAGGGRELVGLDLQSGEERFRLPAPLAWIWHEGVLHVLCRGPEGVRHVRPQAGGEEGEPLPPEGEDMVRGLASAGRAGLVALLDRRLVGLDPATLRATWIHEAGCDLAGSPGVRWAEGEGLAVVEGSQLVFLEIPGGRQSPGGTERKE
ncbi:MAG: protein kinase [Planctomycetes bacterium]|nr:protein kinase [Planctomycetota bacterium]